MTRRRRADDPPRSRGHPGREDVGTPRWVAAVLVLTLTTALCQGFGRLTFPIVLPDMTDDVIGSFGGAGLVSGANLGGYLIGVLGAAGLGQRLRPLVGVKGGVAGTVAGMAVIAIADSPAFLVGGMVLTGASSGVQWISCVATVAARTPPRRYGLALGVVLSGVGIGVAATGGVARIVKDIVGESAWRPVWAMEAGVGVALLVLALFMLRGSPNAPSPGPCPAPQRSTVRNVWTLCGVYGCFGLCHAIYSSFLVAGLVQGSGYQPGAAAGLYALFGLTSTVGGLVLGTLSDRWSARSTMAGGMLVMGVCSAVVPWGRPPLQIVSVGLYGLLFTGVSAVVIAYLASSLGPAQASRAFGVITLAVGFGQLAGAPLGGFLADHSGTFTLTFVAAAVAAVTGCGAALLLPRDVGAGTARRVARLSRTAGLGARRRP